jgi:hypothetical protein
MGKIDHKYGAEGFMMEELRGILNEWDRYAECGYNTRVYFAARVRRSFDFYVRNIMKERQIDE